MTRAGSFLPDQFIIDILKDEMKKYPKAKGFLIDGCPRTLEQAALFEQQIKPCDKILYFKTTEEIMASRMIERGKIEKREDDQNPETIARRIKTFNEKTMPAIRLLQRNYASKFKEVDSSGDVQTVEQLVDTALSSNSICRLF